MGELKDMMYNKMLPESLKRPVVVRCCTEDPEVLRAHQDIQQSKSVHELSKIRNLNEFPLPINVKLPDIPLPSFKAKNLLKTIAPPAAKNNRPKPNQEPFGEYTPASTPRT